MAKTPIEQIAALLESPAPEKQIAAAIVLGELGAKTPEVIKGLVALLETDSPPLQRPALTALTKIASARVAPSIFPLLASKDADVRSLAVDALVACGEDVVPKVKERMAAAENAERKALDGILARFGDRKDAVTALLAGLESTEPDVARNVAFEVRPRIKDADGKMRRLWLHEVLRIVEKMRKSPPPSPIPMATAVKILGYLEDPKGTDPLLELARDPRAPFAVKQEALIALRFALADEEHAAKIIDTMVAAAESDDRMLAQAALMGLVAVELPAKHAGRIVRLAAHPDPERARIAIEKLSRQPGEAVTKALVDVVASADRRRAEMAMKALEPREGAGTLLASALVETTDPDRANIVRQAIKPFARSLPPPTRKKIVAAALERLAEGEGWQAHADVAREADGKALAEGLRDLAGKLGRGKNPGALKSVLTLLARSEHGSDDDRYKLASVLLRDSHKDTRPAARASDESLALLENLSGSSFDVAAALRKDKALELDDLYYVGFHFAEEHNPLGQELLAEVVKKAGRTKIGKMAKNKLEISAEA
jgi:HEAT repeat protein